MCFVNSYNAINHLASADHLKNLKHFLWKYGGGMDRMDAFRILEADVAKVLSYSNFYSTVFGHFVIVFEITEFLQNRRKGSNTRFQLRKDY